MFQSFIAGGLLVIAVQELSQGKYLQASIGFVLCAHSAYQAYRIADKPHKEKRKRLAKFSMKISHK